MSQLLTYHGLYSDYQVTLSKSRYVESKAIAIQALDEDGCPAFTATVNIPGQTLMHDEAFIKTYAENEGVLQFLRECGVVVGDIVKFVNSGYVRIPLCKLNLNRLEELTK